MRLVPAPVVDTLGLMTAASAAYWLVGTATEGAAAALFVLAPPVTVAPWTLLTSVYAHAGLGHLLGNAVVVALAGAAVAGDTTRVRFHAFFLASGALAGVAQILVGTALGPAVGVVGASGAAFALVGYVVVANPASRLLFDRAGLPPRVVVAAVAVVALALTAALSAAGSAVVAHFVGAVVGGVAGRRRLLRVNE